MLNRLRRTAQTFASAFRRRLQNVIETPQSVMNNYSTTISGTSTNSLIPHEDFTIHPSVPGYRRRRYAQIRANSSQLSHQNRVCSLMPQQAHGRIPAESLYLNTYSYPCARRNRRSFIGSIKAAAEIWKQCLHPIGADTVSGRVRRRQCVPVAAHLAYPSTKEPLGVYAPWPLSPCCTVGTRGLQFHCLHSPCKKPLRLPHQIRAKSPVSKTLQSPKNLLGLPVLPREPQDKRVDRHIDACRTSASHHTPSSV